MEGSKQNAFRQRGLVALDIFGLSLLRKWSVLSTRHKLGVDIQEARNERRIAMVKSKDIPKLVDELGRLNAKVADLIVRIDEIKSTLKESGYGEVEGRLFRATISESSKPVTNYEKVFKALKAPASRVTTMLERYTTHTKFQTVRVYSR